MSAHSPGPWEVRFFRSKSHRIDAPGWNELAVVYGNEDDDLDRQGRANARLIAAAPELLAVARRWLRVMGDAGSDRCACCPDEYVCCRCEVVAAIAKAEVRE